MRGGHRQFPATANSAAGCTCSAQLLFQRGAEFLGGSRPGRVGLVAREEDGRLGHGEGLVREHVVHEPASAAAGAVRRRAGAPVVRGRHGLGCVPEGGIGRVKRKNDAPRVLQNVGESAAERTAAVGGGDAGERAALPSWHGNHAPTQALVAGVVHKADGLRGWAHVPLLEEDALVGGGHHAGHRLGPLSVE